MRTAFGVFLLGIFGSFAIWFLSHNRDVFQELHAIDPITLAAVFLLSAGGLYLNGLALEVLARPYGVRNIRYFWLSCAVSFINLIMPFRGGMAFRAWYLKQYHRLSYSAFATGFFGNYVLVFLIYSAFGLLLFGGVFWEPAWPIFSTVLVFGLIFCGSLIVLLKHAHQLPSKNRFIHYWNAFADGWETLIRDKQVLLAMAAIVLGGLLLQSAIIYLLFNGSGHPLTATKALAITIFSVLGIFFSITPGALGVAEGFAVLSAIVLGIPADVTLVIALAKRGVEIVLLFLLGPLGKIILFQKITK